MGWVTVREQGHLAGSDRTGLSQRSASRQFVVIADAATTPAAAETAAAGGVSVPAYGAAHPDDALRVVTKVSVRPDEDAPRTVFRVTVEYGDKPAGEDADPNPLNRPDEVTWDFVDATEPYFMDRSDTPKPVVNSAGQEFEDLPERETGSIVATVRRNVDADGYSPARAIAYKDVVNSAAFFLDGQKIEAGQAKLKAWTAGPFKTENGVTYRETQFVIHFRETWDDVFSDRGFSEKVSGKLVTIVNGTPPVRVDKPYPLNGSGGKKPNPTDAPALLTFRPYFRKSFSVFAFS